MSLLINRLSQAIRLRMLYAVCACLCLLIHLPLQAAETISSPATLSANELGTTTVDASVTVRLLDRSIASLSFDPQPITVNPDSSNSVDLVLSNTGVNDLSDGSITVTPPAGVSLQIVSTANYTATQQLDGSWVLTFVGNIAAAQTIRIPITVNTAANAALGSVNLAASFEARDSILGRPVSQLASNQLQVNIQAQGTQLPANLFLSNSVNQRFVVHDEFVTYTLRVTNISTSTVANNVIISDVLPTGLRLLPGTVKLNGNAFNDPAVSNASAGQILLFNVGDLAIADNIGDTAIIEYMAYISNATPVGTANSPSSAMANNASSNPANASIIIRKDPINSDSHILGRVTSNQCHIDETPKLPAVNMRLQSELVGNQIHYKAIISSSTTELKEYTLNVKLPGTLSFNKGSTSIDKKPVTSKQAGKQHIKIKFNPTTSHWQKVIRFTTTAKIEEHGVFNTQIYGEYIDSEDKHSTSKTLNNRYQAELHHGNFRRFSYWPRFARLGTELKEGDIENIDELLEKVSGETINHIYIVGHADGMKISDQNKIYYESNQALSEARAQATARYIEQKLGLAEQQLSVIGQGASQPITENQTEQGRSINRRVELIVEVVDKSDINKLNIILGDEGYASSQLFTTVEQGTGESHGIEGIRLVTETGRFVDTDEYGLFHFEGMKPGTHVLQIDPASIPSHLEPVQCENNTRFAQSATSQFVEVSDGLIWRANFYLKEKTLAAERVDIGLKSKINQKNIDFTLTASGTSAITDTSFINLKLPETLSKSNLTINLDGTPIELKPQNNLYSIPLGAHNAAWQHQLHFTIDSTQLNQGEYTVSAQINTGSKQEVDISTQTATNSFTLSEGRQRTERYEFSTHFRAGQTALGQADKVTLEDIIFLLRNKKIAQIRVVGHTDTSQLSAEVKAKYGDNYALSRARADAIAKHIKQRLNLSDIKTIIEGKGASQPIARNNTEKGRAENRRAELYITTQSHIESSQLIINRAQSNIEVIVPRFIGHKKDTAVTTPDNPNDKQLGILSLQDGDHVAAASIPLRIKLDSRLKIRVLHNGKQVSNDKIGFQLTDKDSNQTTYTYFGVSTGEPGQHQFTIEGIGPFGNARFKQTVNYIRTGNIHRIAAANEKFENKADGQSPLSARVYLYDNQGERIPAEAKLTIVSGDLKPYVENRKIIDDENSEDRIEVTADGLLQFAPVNKAGLYKVRLAYNDSETDVHVYVSPEYRDWIMVGLAEGTMGSNDVSGNITSINNSDIEEDFYTDGRLAFYAKGQILGKYLLTTAFDSSKENKHDERLQQVINPEDYYTLYGDNTQQQFDAASREKLYIRLDADRFYAMFGDMNTGLDVTDLSRYSRALTGFRAAYESEHASANIFAAETSQAYKRDEILGQGISGLYYLSAQDIVANSESIRIETRDRLRPEVIIETKTLDRFIDYNIDYQDGSLYFKQAVPRNGDNFNPVYIVAEYESYTTQQENIIAGGRVAAKFNDEKIEVGATLVDDNTEGAESQLQGIDLRAQLSSTLEFKAELASTETQNLNSPNLEGDALLAELVHTGDQLDAKAYIREEDSSFGLGQQNQSTGAIRSQGIDTDYRINEQWKLATRVRQEENENTLTERDSVDSHVIYNRKQLEVRAGGNVTETQDNTSNKRTAEKLSLAARQQLLSSKLTLRAQTEYQINEDNNTADHPTRHLIGADYSLSALADIFAEHEIANNQSLKTNTSRAGVRARPWTNGVINTSIENTYSEQQDRANAVFGLSQAIPLSEHWRASFSYDQTTTLRKTNLVQLNPNAPLASGSTGTAIPSTANETDSDFWAVSTGLSYKTTLYLFDNRLEYRDSQLNSKYTLISNFKRELKNGVGHALRLHLFHTDAHQGNTDESQYELLYSSVYRPLDSRWIVLNRTEFKQDENTRRSTGAINKRIIENLAINYMIQNWQVTGHLGYRHQIIDTANREFKTDSFVIGSELRHDLSEYWDIGAQYHRLFTPKLGLAQDSYGLSVGRDIAKNLWLSVGYNAQGYYDEDFSNSGFTAKGFYLKLRFKFDQNTFNLGNTSD